MAKLWQSHMLQLLLGGCAILVVSLRFCQNRVGLRFGQKTDCCCPKSRPNTIRVDPHRLWHFHVSFTCPITGLSRQRKLKGPVHVAKSQSHSNVLLIDLLLAGINAKRMNSKHFRKSSSSTQYCLAQDHTCCAFANHYPHQPLCC